VGAARNSLILVSSTLFCEPCEAYERYFGLLRANLSRFFRVARLDAVEHPGLARRLNVSGVPTVVARTLEGGAVIARSLRRLARSPAELYDFALERWTTRGRDRRGGADPRVATRERRCPKALYCARQPGRPLDYYAAVAALRPAPRARVRVRGRRRGGAAAVRGLLFATDGAHAGAVWRHADCPPRTAKGVGGVVELLERWAAPAMMELTQEGYSDYCQDECVVLLGRPDGRIVERACGVNLSTFWVSGAKMIGEDEGTWVLLRPGEGLFAVLAEKWSSSVADIALRCQRPGALEFAPLPSGFGPDSDPVQILSSFTTVRKTVLEFVWSHFTDVIILLLVVWSCARRLKGRKRPGNAPPIR
jgi:hypothetical protein